MNAFLPWSPWHFGQAETLNTGIVAAQEEPLPPNRTATVTGPGVVDTPGAAAAWGSPLPPRSAAAVARGLDKHHDSS